MAYLLSPFYLLARCLIAIVIDPTILLLATLLAIAFAPPALATWPVDRILVLALVAFTAVNGVWLGVRVRFSDPVILVYLFLCVLAGTSAAWQRASVETWSLLAAEFAVPLAIYVASVQVFSRMGAATHFFRFAVILLLYLLFVAIAFLLGADSLIFPRYILDPAVGIMADRARGPFLQAVANGAAMNLLGLIAWYWWKAHGGRHPLLGFALLLAFLLAMMATLTRSVWVAFGISLLALVWNALRNRQVWAPVVVVLALLVAGLGASLVPAWTDTLTLRAADSGPVDFRMAAYRGALLMVMDHPLLGVGAGQAAAELANYISGYRMPSVVVHNTYLDTALQFGLMGLLLQLLGFFFLWRLGRRLKDRSVAGGLPMLDRQFVGIWHAMLLVVVTNGIFVVMSYQFVNALLFAVGGMVRAHEMHQAIPPAGRLVEC